MIPSTYRTRPTLSFEVYPPKKDMEFTASYKILDTLAELRPDFISVTYGAGGSRSTKTVELASYIQNTLHLTALAHMTCVGNKKEELSAVCQELQKNNIRHVLALRGDRPKDMTDAQYDNRDFTHASDMIAFLKASTDLRLAAACYPEKHYECFSMLTDLQNLKRKQDAGAEFFITQLFFDNDTFYRFRDQAQKMGITIPICAGIMPVTSINQLGTTISLSGSSIPKSLSDLAAAYGDRPEEMRKAGTDYAIRQIQDLLQNDVDGIHIYVMNRPKMTAEIVAATNMHPTIIKP